MKHLFIRGRDPVWRIKMKCIELTFEINTKFDEIERLSGLYKKVCFFIECQN